MHKSDNKIREIVSIKFMLKLRTEDIFLYLKKIDFRDQKFTINELYDVMLCASNDDKLVDDLLTSLREMQASFLTYKLIKRMTLPLNQ
ncbi:hypothetical protein M2128_002189 [Polynucleobacter sphagniphilus]|nr:hypothetical protein [Polynucleobacter sphagniphilus]